MITGVPHLDAAYRGATRTAAWERWLGISGASLWCWTNARLALVVGGDGQLRLLAATAAILALRRPLRSWPRWPVRCGAGHPQSEYAKDRQFSRRQRRHCKRGCHITSGRQCCNRDNGYSYRRDYHRAHWDSGGRHCEHSASAGSTAQFQNLAATNVKITASTFRS